MFYCCPRFPNLTPFRSTSTRFTDNWGFWFPSRVQWWIWNVKTIGRTKLGQVWNFWLICRRSGVWIRAFEIFIPIGADVNENENKNSLKFQYSKLKKSQIWFCKDNWEENSEVSKLSATIRRRMDNGRISISWALLIQSGRANNTFCMQQRDKRLFSWDAVDAVLLGCWRFKIIVYKLKSLIFPTYTSAGRLILYNF